MDRDALQQRTKAFALRVIKLVDALPNTTSGREVGRQLHRSATSVGANYRAARRVRRSREFIAKISIVCEEADESEYWLELVRDGGLIKTAQVALLLQEASELTKIVASTRRTAKSRTKTSNRQITNSPNSNPKDAS